jgi:hypothetical protein
MYSALCRVWEDLLTAIKRTVSIGWSLAGFSKIDIKINYILLNINNMESNNSESSYVVKTIGEDDCDDVKNVPKKSPKGRKPVLKLSDFKSESDSARFTKKVKGIELPCNFIQKSVEVSKVKTIVQKVIHKIKQINHQDVEHNGQKYTVCYVLNNNTPVLFIIDTIDKEKVIYNSVSVYSGYPRLTNNSTEFIHQLVMGKSPSDKYSIDHVNRIRRDDRKCNLKFKTASEQIQNQFIRERTSELPEDCGITHDDIPKNVIYRNEKGRGERFEIEINGFPHLPKKILYKKTTSRTDIPLRIKLQTAIYYLRWLCEKYPELKSSIRINKKDEDERLRLTEEYNDIIRLTSFPQEVIDANTVNFIYDCKNDYSIEDDEIVEKVVKTSEAGKKKEDNLPNNCGFNKMDIPKYCYYVPETESRGDKFVIDRHPKLLSMDKRQIATPGSKLLSTKEKFDILLEYIHCLENDLPIVQKDAPRGKRGQFSINIQKDTSKPISKKIDKPSSADKAKDIESKDIPRYVYYKPANKDHGSCWFIKDHPNLVSRNIKTKISRTSALISDREKFEEILCHLDALENNTPFKEYKVVRAVKNSIHKDKCPKRVPDNWDIEQYPICDHLYYRPADDKQGDSWVIMGHPKQHNKIITSSTSKNKSTIDKYLQARSIINTLELNN